jgi:hypothetical protein
MNISLTELITENIASAINQITIANGFNQDLTAIRRRRTDFTDVAPVDGSVIIIMLEDEPVPPPVDILEWKQKFAITALVIDSDQATTPIETRMAQVRDDIRKKLVEDTTRGGYAIDTILGAATPFDDGESFTGIILEIDVHYRTKFEDPYTKM